MSQATYRFKYPLKYSKLDFAEVFKVNKFIRTIFAYDFLCEIEDMSGRVLTVHIGEIIQLNEGDITVATPTADGLWDESDEQFNSENMDLLANTDLELNDLTNESLDEDDRDTPSDEFIETLLDDEDEDF